MVVVADRLRESFWRVSSYMKGNAYAREHNFSNKCRAFNGFLRVCVRGKDMSLLLLLEKFPKREVKLKLFTSGR